MTSRVADLTCDEWERCYPGGGVSLSLEEVNDNGHLRCLVTKYFIN